MVDEKPSNELENAAAAVLRAENRYYQELTITGIDDYNMI
jgi:hypothetical protein